MCVVNLSLMLSSFHLACVCRLLLSSRSGMLGRWLSVETDVCTVGSEIVTNGTTVVKHCFKCEKRITC